MHKIFKFFTVLIFFMFCSAGASGQTTEAISLQEKAWISLSYNKIPSNEVKFTGAGLTIKVRNSAGPIIHKLSAKQRITGFKIKGKFTGNKVSEMSAFDEDSILRLGLVAVGDKKLSGAKRWFAADWVKKLFALAPKNTGLDKIYFFNVTDRKNLVGKTRTHPKSELISENIFAVVSEAGNFELTKKLDSAIDTLALWISTDGDDTKSEFETLISEIEITTEL